MTALIVAALATQIHVLPFAQLDQPLQMAKTFGGDAEAFFVAAGRKRSIVIFAERFFVFEKIVK